MTWPAAGHFQTFRKNKEIISNIPSRYCTKPATALLASWMWLTVVTLPGSFRNPGSYDTSTLDIRVTACPLSTGLSHTS